MPKLQAPFRSLKNLPVGNSWRMDETPATCPSQIHTTYVISMKILFHTREKQEIYTARVLLAVKGIPTFIGSESSGPALGCLFADQYTLWVCLDNQYQDAVDVLANQEHEVKQPVDVQDYQSYFDKLAPVIMKKMMYAIMPGAVLAVIGLFVLYMALSR